MERSDIVDLSCASAGEGIRQIEGTFSKRPE
jgi:hypothetical protein